MDLKGYQNVVIFDRDYPKEKQAETIAMAHAVVYGHCERCGFLKTCAQNYKFQPPEFAWCKQEKQRILDGLEQKSEDKQVALDEHAT